MLIMTNLIEKIKKLEFQARQKQIKKNEAYAIEDSKKTVTQSNRLTRAAQSLTLNEKRAIYIAISNINPMRNDNSLNYKVTAIDFAKLFDIKLNNAYRDLKAATDKLFEREWRVKDEIKIQRNRWISSAEYREKEGYVELSFTPATMSNLQALRSEFTKYKLSEVVDFKHMYSWRLFELFADKANAKKFEGWLKISADDLRFSLDVPESYSTGMFHKKVLQTAIDELSVKRNLVIKLEYKKTGRKITQYNFVFCENDQQKLHF